MRPRRPHVQQSQIRTLVLLIQVLGLTACANLNSIGRSTELPRLGTESEGIAIHLARLYPFR
jgi:hypothetical protein